MAIRFFIPFYTRTTPFYTLKITYDTAKTKIEMFVPNNITTTQDLPGTLPILKNLLPNIFTSECFNYLDTSFEKEVENTEVGHLFEHILLEYLCTTKLLYGYNDAEYSGVTKWNWNKYPRGTFSIQINAHYSDRIIFNEALKKAIALMNIIFEESSKKEYYGNYLLNPTPIYTKAL